MFEKLFKLKEHNTDVKTEILAGITVFMTMAYILAVNPNILSATGMNSMVYLLPQHFQPLLVHYLWRYLPIIHLP